jgi:hypothetical protein
MSDEVQSEVERLISIAQLHAWNALARPAAERDSHLAVCRDFWKHYAAAFTTTESQCDGFADALERATRDLMAEMEKNAAVIRTADALTLDELRPIFRRIIGQ